MRVKRWFAGGHGINGQMQRQGPYETDIEAAEQVIMANGIPMEGAFIWPELVDVASGNEDILAIIKDSNKFPCDISPKARLYNVT